MIRVLIIDDSPLVRALLKDMLSKEEDIEVVGAVRDPTIARERFKEFSPDVILLDLVMPIMDGLEFFKGLMAYRPTPVIFLSKFIEEGDPVYAEAMANGAYAIVEKPGSRNEKAYAALGPAFIDTIRRAYEARDEISRRARNRFLRRSSH